MSAETLPEEKSTFSRMRDVFSPKLKLGHNELLAEYDLSCSWTTLINNLCLQDIT